MGNLILLCGYPASGKTTFAKYLLRVKSNIVRISMDDLYRMCTVNYDKNMSEQYKLMEQSMINSILTTTDVIVDRTSLTIKDRTRFIDIARFNKSNIDLYHIITPFNKCSEINNFRPYTDNNGFRVRVPHDVMEHMRSSFEAPSPNEGFNSIYQVKWSRTNITDVDNISVEANPIINTVYKSRNVVVSSKKPANYGFPK